MPASRARRASAANASAVARCFSVRRTRSISLARRSLLRSCFLAEQLDQLVLRLFERDVLPGWLA
jgi:hypothetical protein